MLVIRLQTVGRKNQRSFRLVVTPKRSGPGGRPVELLGFWNPRLKQAALKKERILYWMSKGAKPSATAHNLFVKYGVITGKKVPVHKKKKGEAPTASAEASQPVTTTEPAKESEKQESSDA